MKFTDGYWQNKPEYDFNFAIQSFSGAITGDALRVVCATVPIRGRGDLLNHATLTVTFTSLVAWASVAVSAAVTVTTALPAFAMVSAPVEAFTVTASPLFSA